MGSSWTFVDEEFEIGTAIIGWPLAPLFMAVSLFGDWEWDDPYMNTKDVVLHFRWESEGPTPARYTLVRWEMIQPVVSSGYAYSPAWQQQSMWQQQQQWGWQQTQTRKDIRHHKKRHKHHASGYKHKGTPSRASAPKHDHSRGPKNPPRDGNRKHK